MAHFIDFHIGGWRVGSLDSTSGVFVGHNLQYGWRSSSKDNGAAPSVVGDYNVVQGAMYSVLDPDFVDTWVQKSPPLANLPMPSPALARHWATRRKQVRSASRQRSPFQWDF